MYSPSEHKMKNVIHVMSSMGFHLYVFTHFENLSMAFVLENQTKYVDVETLVTIKNMSYLKFPF